MAGVFGSNTIFSTFTKYYSGECEPLGKNLQEKVRKCIFNDTICPNPECYSKCIDLLKYVDRFNNQSLTFFMFDNGSYDLTYKNPDTNEQNKIIKSHLVLGQILPETLDGRIKKVTTSDRKFFYIDGINNVIFQLIDNYPVVYANIIGYTIAENVIIYFIDMPLFSLDQLYIDSNSV